MRPKATVAHFRDALTLPSRVAYLSWRLLRLRTRLEVHLKRGERILLRPIPAEDYGAARGVFVALDYDPPRKALRPVQRIVDLGANIGCSCLFWLRQYPECRIEAFEPHPVHLEMLRENLLRNGIQDRVQVYAAAAGVRESSMFLSDRGMSSRISSDQRPGHHRVPVVDFFETAGRGAIDLLKIDVEGSEYELLADVRFPAVQAHTVVLEWHPTGQYPEESGRTWCWRRLTEAGYVVEEHKGLLWGWRD